MLAKPGNMGEVYRAFERQRIARDAERTVRDMDIRQGVLEAEIVDETPGAWYLVTAAAGCEHVAANHLIRRRFGCYQPIWHKTYISRGHKYSRARSLFPGYIFVFVWGIERHYQRIRNCPGVQGLVMHAGRPAVIPDSFINRVQVQEAVEDGLVQANRHKRRRRRKRAETPFDNENWEIRISCKSFWRKMDTLDDDGRNDLLHRALGLDS